MKEHECQISPYTCAWCKAMFGALCVVAVLGLVLVGTLLYAMVNS